MLHEVVQAKPTRAFKVYVYFSDGKIKLYDMTPFLGSGVFKQISLIDDFMAKCTVLNRTLAWDIAGNYDASKCIDVDPETIYSDAVEVTDPLLEAAG